MPSRPNLLFILSDQHAADFAGFAGDPVARTPHLDALAARGVQFDSALCASPLCSPSRMCLLTGKDAHRCAAWNNHWVIFTEHLTWPGHFVEQGYRTCLVGKMHFGGQDQMQGFEDRPYGDLRHGLGHQPEPLSMFPGYAAVRSAGPTEIPESLLQDVVVTRETLSYIKEHAAGDDGRPWFVCASYSRPHPPLTSPGRYLRRYRGQVPPPTNPAPFEEAFARRRASGHADLSEEEVVAGREGYYACIEFLDDCIGELLDGLERDGLLENTIVVYASDHGEMLGSRGIWGKSVYFDPAVRVPLLIAGPGVATGRRTRRPVSLVDLFPTTCELAGLPLPEGLDGASLAPLLADPETAAPPREAACSSYFQYGQTISHPAPVDEGEPCRAWRLARSADWKLVEVEGGATLLFDLASDPGEERDLASDLAHAERVRSMREIIHRGFSWDQAREQLEADRARLPAYKSGRAPSTPNQYRLPDGREFDAEGALYGARWLPIQPGSNGGIIPQQFG